MTDTIKDTLRKIQALTQSSNPNEREAARLKLETLLQKHGISIDELTSEETECVWFKYKNAFEDRLLNQIVPMVTDSRTFKTYMHSYRRKKNETGVYLTPAQAADVRLLYEQYRTALAEEFEVLYRAFIQRNNIFAQTPPADGESVKEFKMDAKTLRMLALSKHLTRVPVRRTNELLTAPESD
jgi:hypothetical protein